MNIVSVILARGGSKGIPGKNIIDLNGKPLVYYSIQASLDSNVDDTFVGTDDYEKIDPQLMVEWILAENLPVRMQMQMHKMIWSPDKQGV